MLYLIIKALISGVIVVTVSEVAKRYPGLGGLIASLPLVSVLGMIWLCGTPAIRRAAARVEAVSAVDARSQPVPGGLDKKNKT